MIDLLVIGNITRDFIKLNDHAGTLRRLGGSALYTGIVATKLEMKTAIVSKVGTDFGPLEWQWLGKTGLTCFISRGVHTTSFEISYNKDRTLSLMREGSKLGVKDIPRGLNPNCVHIGSVASEVPPSEIRILTSRVKHASLDAQGYTRERNAGRRDLLDDRSRLSWLEGLTLLKASIHEARTLVPRRNLEKIVSRILTFGPQIVACTLGEEGTVLADENRCYFLPGYPVRRVLDPTGAGDAFVAGFWSEYLKSSDLLSSGVTGVAAASVLVETDRLGLDTTLSEVSKRALVLKKRVRILKL